MIAVNWVCLVLKESASQGKAIYDCCLVKCISDLSYLVMDNMAESFISIGT